MPEPVTLALGVAIGKLLLRWADLNDTADALADAKAGFSALKALHSRKAADPVSTALAGLLDERLAGVRDQGRRGQMRIAVANVADLFAGLSDDDIRIAAQYPQGFPEYLARGPGHRLLVQTEEALTPFTRQLMDAGAGVFAELAPRSGRFVAAALVRLLDQVHSSVVGVAEVQTEIAAARAELAAVANRVAESVDALHPKVDRILEAAERTSPATAVEATQRATREGVFVGPPIGQMDPNQLGVHTSITINDETTLTPYLLRRHDQQLRGLLEECNRPGARCRIVLVVGTSCTGKTRTMYEAILEILPDWQLTAPASDTDLAHMLARGVPAHTIVWLDEIQDRLTKSAEGISSAKGIYSLLSTPDVGPILFAGTVWPTNFATLLERPSPQEASAGEGAVRAVLAAAIAVHVPETFTDADLALAGDIRDPRLQKAIDTASRPTHPEQGRKITQLLAGGTQLVLRLYPPDGIPRPGDFTPGAKAVLLAVGELRRVGMPNPLPAWAIEGAAPGYLRPPDERPSQLWLPSAIAEATRAADQDDPLTGIHSLDIHAEGVPALTPHWSGTAEGTSIVGYDLHDYLFQDHVTRHQTSPTARQLWATVVVGSGSLTEETASRVWSSAQRRGLFSWSLGIARARNGPGNPWARQLTDSVAEMDDVEGLRLLLSHGGGLYPIWPLVRFYAARGDKAALLEMHLAEHERVFTAGAADDAGEDAELWRNLSAALDQRTQDWRHRGAPRPEGWWQPTIGASQPTYVLLDLLVQDGDLDGLRELFIRGVAGSDRAISDLLLGQGDEVGLLQLVEEDGVEYALARLADLYIAQDRTEDLDRLRDTRDRYVSTERLRYYRRHEDQARLESALEVDPGDTVALHLLIDLFVDHRDEEALLRLRETHRFLVLDRLADIRRARQDEAGLRELTSYRLPRGHTHEYPLRQWIELLIDLHDEKGLRGFRQQGHTEVLQRIVRDRAERHDLDALQILVRVGAPSAAEALRASQPQPVEERIERIFDSEDPTQLSHLVHAGTPGAANVLIALLRSHSDRDGPTELDEAATLIPARTLFRPAAQ